MAKKIDPKSKKPLKARAPEPPDDDEEDDFDDEDDLEEDEGDDDEDPVGDPDDDPPPPRHGRQGKGGKAATPPRTVADPPKPGKSASKKASEPAMTRAAAEARMEELRERYDLIRTDQSSAAMNERVVIAREQNVIARILFNMEEWVTVKVPAAVTGECFKINDTWYPPGEHRVRASVAQVLLNMIYRNQEEERKLFKQNGRNIDLGEIGQKARMDEMQRD